jgi:ribA/ribD-fused uncharacterized protein
MSGEMFSGKLDFLSNFYYSPIEYENHVYPTVEHAFQAAKTFDFQTRKYIRELSTPALAKKAGRKVKIDWGDWDTSRLDIMEDLLRIKFSDPALRQKLIETKDLELVETNWWNDQFWGVCNGIGQNNLGKILMSLREEYSKQ